MRPRHGARPVAPGPERLSSRAPPISDARRWSRAPPCAILAGTPESAREAEEGGNDMARSVAQILALGGGGFSMKRDGCALDDYALSLTGAERPRVCFLPTASGDADHYVVRFYRRFSPTCDANHVSLFRRDQGTGGVEDDLAAHLLAQDLIYVGGGNVVSMLGAWRAHGLDTVLRRAWRAGIVLCGPSAGSLCWFEEALTAFHGAPRATRGLGLLPYSNCVHYDAEPGRRGEYHRLVADGMPAGFAVEDGVGLHFTGTRLAGVVSSRRDGRAYLVQRCAETGRVLETALAAEPLPARERAPAALPAAQPPRMALPA
jgi:peptidase E